MRNTSPGVERSFREQMLKMTGSERLLMGCSMYDMSKSIVKASILAKQPNINAQDLKLQLFLRFYKHDYEKEELNRIIQHLRNSPQSSKSEREGSKSHG